MSSIGSVTFSLDTEISWGVIGTNLFSVRDSLGIYENLRPKLREFLHLLDEHNFPCTWAFVGAMLESNRHMPYPNEKYKVAIENAYRLGKKSSFEGSDLLHCVLESKVQHEIAWHSYYHITYDVLNADYVRKDLQKAQEIAQRYGIEISSLVFPLNIEGHHDIFKEMGIKICRIRENRPFLCRFSRTIYRLHKLYSLFFSVPPSSVISCKKGLFCVSGSMFLLPPTYNDFMLKLYQRWVIKSIDFAVSRKKNIHFWLHPFDLVLYPKIYKVVTTLIEYASYKQSQQQLQIVRMKDLVETQYI